MRRGLAAKKRRIALTEREEGLDCGCRNKSNHRFAGEGYGLERFAARTSVLEGRTQPCTGKSGVQSHKPHFFSIPTNATPLGGQKSENSAVFISSRTIADHRARELRGGTTISTMLPHRLHAPQMSFYICPASRERIWKERGAFSINITTYCRYDRLGHWPVLTKERLVPRGAKLMASFADVRTTKVTPAAVLQ